MKYPLGGRHLDFGHLRAGGIEGFAVHEAPVQFLQQIGHVGRDQINDFQFQRFLRGDRSALFHCGLGPFDVTLALARDRLHVADGKIFELLLHGFVWLFFATTRKTTDGNRMRSADRSGRRHCRDTGRQRDETPCAGRCRAGRRDVNHDGNWRPEEALHNFLRRIEQTARRIQLNHQALHILRFGFFDASGNVTRCRRPDRAVDADKANFLRGEHGRCRSAGQAKKDAGQRNLHSILPNRWTVLRKLKLLS